MTTEPRTEAGKELLAMEDYNSRSFPLITAQRIIDIEIEARKQLLDAARAAAGQGEEERMSRDWKAPTPRGFSRQGEDDPRRDFMATYFDHDDDVTRGVVEDYLDRIETMAQRADRERMAQAVERGEWDDVFRGMAAGKLDAAWAEAEAALPEGWRLASLLSPGDYGPDDGWEAHAQNENGATARALGTTPADALRELARRLTRQTRGD